MNQRRGVLVISMADSLSMRMLWEMVSKAALRSRRIMMERKPESAARRTSEGGTRERGELMG